MTRGIRSFLTLAMVILLILPGPSSLASSAREVQIGDEVFYIVRTSNRDGHIVKQIVAGQDQYDIALDYDGDGTMDFWEKRRGDLTLLAQAPYAGHFTMLTARERLKDGTLEIDFRISRDRSSYELVSQTFEPYKMIDKTYRGILVGDTCSPGEENTYKEAQDWRNWLAAIGERERFEKQEQLQCVFHNFQKFIFDKSCLTGAFRDSVEEASLAMIDVMLSSFGEMYSTKETPNSRFLACLNRNELSNHAARIEAIFWGRLASERGAHSVAILELYSRDNSIDLRSRLGQNGCERSSAPYEPIKGHQPKPLFRCQETSDPKKIASFDPNNEQIVLRKTHLQAGKLMLQSSRDAYASTLFHEMLHASGMSEDDHDYVRDIEACCAGGLSDISTPCKKMRAETDKKKMALSYQSVFLGSFPEFGKIFGDVKEVFGPDLAEQLMADYFSGIHSRAEFNRRKRDECLARSKANGGVCDAACQRTCEDVYLKLVRDQTPDTFGKSCLAYREAAKTSQSAPSKAKNVDCDSLTSRLVSMASLKSVEQCVNPELAMKHESLGKSRFPWALADYFIGLAQAKSLKSVLENQGKIENALSDPILDKTCLPSVADGTSAVINKVSTPLVESLSDLTRTSNSTLPSRSIDRASDGASNLTLIKKEELAAKVDESYEDSISQPYAELKAARSSSKGAIAENYRQRIASGPVFSGAQIRLGERSIKSPDHLSSVPKSSQIFDAVAKVAKAALPEPARAAGGSESVASIYAQAKLSKARGAIPLNKAARTLSIPNLISGQPERALGGRDVSPSTTNPSGGSGVTLTLIDGPNSVTSNDSRVASGVGAASKSGPSPARLPSQRSVSSVSSSRAASLKGRSVERKIASESSEASVPDLNFKEEPELIAFLTQPFDKVEPHLRSVDLSSSAVRHRIQFIGPDKVPRGARKTWRDRQGRVLHPKKFEYCSSRNSLVLGGCAK